VLYLPNNWVSKHIKESFGAGKFRSSWGIANTVFVKSVYDFFLYVFFSYWYLSMLSVLLLNMLFCMQIDSDFLVFVLLSSDTLTYFSNTWFHPWFIRFSIVNILHYRCVQLCLLLVCVLNTLKLKQSKSYVHWRVVFVFWESQCIGICFR